MIASPLYGKPFDKAQTNSYYLLNLIKSEIPNPIRANELIHHGVVCVVLWLQNLPETINISFMVDLCKTKHMCVERSYHMTNEVGGIEDAISPHLTAHIRKSYLTSPKG